MMRRAAKLAMALAAIAGAAGTIATPPQPAAEILPGGTPAGGFEQALAPRAFVFPQDHGPHPQFREEWWYVTGNLDGAGAQRFGFELTFFRVAFEPPGPKAGATATGAAPAEPASAWRTRQVYMAHFAVTDVAGGGFRFAQKLSRDALGLAGAEGSPLRVWIDDWSLSAAGSSSWTLHAQQPGYQLDLTLEPQSAPVLNGIDGLSRKASEPDDASYYYSIPRLVARGRLTRADGVPVSVHGRAWLDREWGSGGLGAREVGWDWFGLQLDDGTALMFYALRDRDGGRDPHSAGTWITASGEARALPDREVQIAVTAHWTDREGVRYPSGWRVQVPALALDVAVHPVLPDQELRTRPRYWEGAVDVSGTRGGGALRGRGYVELVGYAPPGG